MRKLTYFAVFEPDGNGGFGVYFPDLPGCISAGNDLEQAQAMAAEALGLHIYGMEKDGEALPNPSKTPTVDPDTQPGFLVSPITVFPDIAKNEMDNRAVRTNTTIPAWLKDLAEEKGINYSMVLQSALIEVLGVQDHNMRL